VSSGSLTGKSGTVSFEPRARIMKLLGGELVSDEVVAVTELVKNAYDADARTVTIEFRDVLSGDSEIIVSDDGHGMSIEEVTDYWMQPGGTTKSGARKATSRGGRKVLGEKGIGRFAVDKLGAKLEMTTRKKGQTKEVLVGFDWRDFEHDTRMLCDVHCAWEVRAAQTLRKQGTELRITGLHVQWNERLFRKLCLRLGRLKTPFADADNFKMVIESDDFPDYSGEVSVDYLDRSPHHVEAQFDGDQVVTLIDGDGQAEDLVWNGDGYLDCGPVRIRFFGFDLETPSISKLGPIREVRGWLREWTGVSIYRDGFRLSPYGEPSDDWLRLDQRRVNNPVVRLSNNQLIGFVEISREQNPNLVDQTSREGMIANKAFEDLRRLSLFVLQQMEAKRQLTRHPVTRGPSSENCSAALHRSVAEELDSLAEASASVRPEKLRAIARRVRDNAEGEQRRARALADGYGELAAVGQIAEVTTLRVSSIVGQIKRDLAELSNGSTKMARAIQKKLSILEDELTVMDPIKKVQGTRRRTTDLHKELHRAVAGFRGRLDERNIEVDLPGYDAELVRVEMRPENLQRVLIVLFQNSLDWLHRTASPRIKVTVDTSAYERQCAILVTDNGPGFPASMAERAFEPMETGREGARGMGLTIARNIVEGVSGSIEILQDKRRKGAAIRILLPRKKAKGTRKR
jgi:signal transduction histidine kinase